MFKVPEKYRVSFEKHPNWGSDASFGNNGVFMIPIDGITACVIASDGLAWNHVSVHMIENDDDLTPTWEEMCIIKDMFWDEDDCVVQYHPPKSDYVNYHKNTLHLWQPIAVNIPRPPKELVGGLNTK